jgi:hypothetical protein
MTTIVEDTDIHQPHVWSRPLRSQSHERGHVKLAWAASIPLCHEIKKYTKRRLHQKHQRPQQHCCAYLCKTSTHRSRSNNTEGFRSIENKKFPTKMNRNKPRYDLRDAKQRGGKSDLHTLVDRTTEAFR